MFCFLIIGKALVCQNYIKKIISKFYYQNYGQSTSFAIANIMKLKIMANPATMSAFKIASFGGRPVKAS